MTHVHKVLHLLSLDASLQLALLCRIETWPSLTRVSKESVLMRIPIHCVWCSVCYCVR